MAKDLFDNIPSNVAALFMNVKNGSGGLSDLQRPFVWKDNTSTFALQKPI